MKQIIVTTQKEYDKVKSDFEGEIIIRDTKEWLCLNRSFDNAFQSVSDNATIQYVYGNATIKSVYGNATIQYVYGNATIKYVSDNATIKSVYGNATIQYVYDNATIKYVSDNATIQYVYDNATIQYVYGNATILLMTGLASIVLLYKAKKIVAQGMNLIRQIGTEKIDITKSKSVTFVQIKKTIRDNPSFEMYSKLYPVKVSGKKAILYKAVHKIGGKYLSEHDRNFEYKIGEIKEEVCSSSKEKSCSSGIHLSHLNWARLFGKDWVDCAILECETDIKDIVVSRDCDGKLRTSKIKVIRELNKDEY